jgi:CRP/FNR family transcriptional regulator, cyclic AMP receptor protein
MAVDVSRIQQVPIFVGLSDAQVAAIASRLEERHVDPGRHLTSEGAGGYFFFVIDSGEARVTKGDDIIATFGPGDFFGEAAIFKTTRRTATVIATSPVTVLAMFGADFAMLSDEIPELKKRIDATIAQRLPRTSSP